LTSFPDLAAVDDVAMPADTPLCPSFSQPASRALAGPERDWAMTHVTPRS
jgi:hypothetical protein